MGRPQGALRGRTAQANALAQWLRTLTGHVRVRELEADLHAGRSSWAAYRNGSTLIPAALLRAVVQQYVADAAMRERQPAEGLRLLEEAQRAGAALKDGSGSTPAAGPGTFPRPGPPQGATGLLDRPREPLAMALLRLDDARLLQMEAMLRLADSEKRCALLSSTVKVLQDRCLVLEGERDRALEDRARLQRELDLSLEYRRQASEQLEHARLARTAAERLALTADEHVTRERIVVERQATGAARTEASRVEPARTTDAGADLGLAPLDQVAAVLRSSGAQLAEQDEELDDLSGRLGAEPGGDPVALPPIVQGAPLDNGFPGQRGVVRPEAVRDTEQGTETVPAPVVGPGQQVVAYYRAADGSTQRLSSRSVPGAPHVERRLAQEFDRMGVGPEAVLEVHSNLQPCALPGGYCADRSLSYWGRARVVWSVPYGARHEERRESMRTLTDRLALDRPFPPPVRAPLPPAPAVPTGSGIESATRSMSETFLPKDIVRISLRDSVEPGMPGTVGRVLRESGLPRAVDPFFWSLPSPDSPWPTPTDTALLGDALRISGADIHVVLGHDTGRALCVERSLHVVALPLDGIGSLPALFVNSGTAEFAHCLALLGRMWPTRLRLGPVEAGAWTREFQEALQRLDPPALAAPENWWSVLVEQMWDGLL